MTQELNFLGHAQLMAGAPTVAQQATVSTNREVETETLPLENRRLSESA